MFIGKIFITLLLTSILAMPGFPNRSLSKPDQVTDVKAALDIQVAAWNAGDLEKAMTFYWNSPEMIWISRSGVEKGYQPVLEGYRKDFADRTKMGVYAYEPLHIEALSKTSVYYVFRWKIELNGKKLMGGVSSQIWKRIKGRWLITSEHAG
jgi:ketosteroid isomerase-like protein